MRRANQSRRHLSEPLRYSYATSVSHTQVIRGKIGIFVRHIWIFCILFHFYRLKMEKFIATLLPYYNITSEVLLDLLLL